MEIENASAPNTYHQKVRRYQHHSHHILQKGGVCIFLYFALTTNVTEYVNVENENASPTSETDVAFDM